VTRVDIWFCDLYAVAGRRMQVTEQAARDGLRRVLGRYLDVPPDEVRLVRAACPGCGARHGRPELDPVHGGESRLRFSMAHCTGLAAYAVAPVCVGVDAEALTARIDRHDLRSTLHPGEQSVAASATRRDLLGCWVRKEAYLKGLGIGLGREPDTVHVGIPPDVPAEPRQVGGPDGWTLVDLPTGPDHVAAAAVAVPSSDSVSVRLHQLTGT
jgi:4'-phosphopantetheinyl transferase